MAPGRRFPVAPLRCAKPAPSPLTEASPLGSVARRAKEATIMLDPDCIFCKIIKGEVPSFKVLEDERTLAFMDINPANPGHVLVIPKVHAPDLFEIGEPWLAASVDAVQKVARAVRATLDPYGVNIVQANGPGAAQSVLHFHWHVLPRTRDDGLRLNWGLTPGDINEIGALSERIRRNIAAGG
jgi:histidine triad (HIT) family protein